MKSSLLFIICKKYATKLVNLQNIGSLLIMSSDEYDEDVENEMMRDNDPETKVTVESIITNLFKSFFNDYGSDSYWEERYQSSDEMYEWFQSWDSILPHIEDYLTVKGDSLNIGCGNSIMAKDMIDSGFKSVLSIDISPTLIQKMSQRYQNEPNLYWKVMDCTHLDVEANSFDFVVDKGTIDALYCDCNMKVNVESALNEITRVLKQGCYFIDISYGDPSIRQELVTYPNLILIEQKKIPNPHRNDQFHYIYIFKKE